MKKIMILCILGLLCPFFEANAQKHYLTKPLNVGDSVPDLTIQNIINYKSKTVKLSEYKDKLVILDFWSLLCVPCIEHMPVIYSLQKQFGDKVFFLLVNSNPKFDKPAKISAFFNARKNEYNLPSVILDSILWNTFQPPSLGTYVWIKNGVIHQITDGEEITADNIKKEISDEKLIIRQTTRIENDYKKSLFDEGNGTKLPSKYFMRSMLFPYSPGLEGAGWQTDSTGKVYRVSFINTSVYSLLLAANPDFTHFYNRVKKITKYPDLLIENLESDTVRQKYEFCYEAIFSPVSKKKAAEYIKQDMARYFPYELDSTQVVDSCWILKLPDTKKLIIRDTKNTGTNIYENFGTPIHFNNLSISSLRFALEQYFQIPVLDETGYKNNVWLDLPADITNVKKVVESLRKQGIIVIKDKRPVEYLVIKDRNALINNAK